MRHRNLTNVDGTIGKVFLDNRDRLLNKSKSADDIRQTVNVLFRENNINTPKSRMIQFKMLGMKFNDALLYVQNIIFAADNMNVK
jgi:hypothetical protein